MFANGGRCIFSSALLWIFLSSKHWHHVQANVELLNVDEGPQDAAVFPGGNVSLACDLRNVDGYNVYWRHRQTNRDLSNRRQVNQILPQELQTRLSIVGDVDEDVFTLRIDNVQVADGGEYFCEFNKDGGIARLIAGSAELTVLILPSPDSPQCSAINPAGTGDHLAVGDTVHLQCSVMDGNPLPTVTFYKKDVLLAGPARAITHQYDITEDDNGVIFNCSMTTPALDEPRNCSVMPLRILPNATILPAVSRVEEGSYALFDCHGEGLPYIAKYRWTVTNNDTGIIIPAERYTVSQDGRSVEIAAMENLELHCTVTVPSGLSGNTTARIEVLKLDVTTGLSNKQPSPTNEPLSSTTVVAVVVAVVIAGAVIVLIILLLWQRKRHRKSTSPPDGARMRQGGGENDEVAEVRGEQENEENRCVAALGETVDDKRDGAVTSEYLEMRESPTRQDNQEYAYAAVQEDKTDETGNADMYEVVSVGTIDKMAGQAPDNLTQDSSGYEEPTKMRHEYATVKE